MNWKFKAAIQNALSALPMPISYRAYYLVQRYLGSLRTTSPVNRLLAGAEIIHRVQQAGCSVDGKTFLEVGTGHQLNIPTACWLCGAERSITVDLNPYLRSELVQEDLSYCRKNPEAIAGMFKEHAEPRCFEQRFRELIQKELSLDEFLRMANIEYVSPADAAHLGLTPQTIDFHVSYTTLEHMPPETLRGALLESSRVLKEDGLFVHLIDLTDHFSHSDRSISSINFLQFSDAEWLKYAGNRYMYQNRLRIDEYLDFIEESGLRLVSMEARIDAVALNSLRHGLSLDERFRNKPEEINATTRAWIIARPAAR